MTRILIVGGTAGLGLAVARAVAERGDTPVVASRRPESVKRALDELPAHAEGTTVDLADPASIGRLFDQAGQLDHLVYTAGEPLQVTPLADLTPARARAFWETRYFGALAVVREAAARGGVKSIVLTGGTAAYRPNPGWALGASICGAMESLTRELALELAPTRVNLVAPGVTRTALWSEMDQNDVRQMFDGLGEKLAEPEDVARAYLYAMDQPMATGTTLVVDGGSVLL